MASMKIIIVDMMARMYVGGHLQGTFNSRHYRSHLCQLCHYWYHCHCPRRFKFLVLLETVFGLQQVELPSHLQNSEQDSCADEQLNLCEEQDLSLLQLQLFNLSMSNGTNSTPLGSDTGQYAPDGRSDVQPNSSGSSSGGSFCNAAFQLQA